MKYLFLLISLPFAFSCTAQNENSVNIENQQTIQSIEENNLDKYDVAYFASGCFWCVEAIYESVDGVVEAVSGYSGGETEAINYRISNNGRTNHAEALAVYYDKNQISFSELVDVYFASQDPTQEMGQGPDCGSQYRSILFYQSDAEKKIIDSKIAELDERGVAVAAEVKPFEFFVVAEDYHQDFKKRNPNHPYIKSVSDKRFKKFQEEWEE